VLSLSNRTLFEDVISGPPHLIPNCESTPLQKKKKSINQKKDDNSSRNCDMILPH
jgi:hypothetical protein